MALTVEDGTGLAAADSYISEADATTYATNLYGATDTFAALASGDAKDAILRRAAQYIEILYGHRYAGTRNTLAQALAWPRTGATGPDGYDLPTNETPEGVKRAQVEAARRIAGGTDVLADLERGGMVKREQVGPIAVEYADGAPATTTITQIERLVAPYITGGGVETISLVRA